LLTTSELYILLLYNRKQQISFDGQIGFRSSVAGVPPSAAEPSSVLPRSLETRKPSLISGPRPRYKYSTRTPAQRRLHLRPRRTQNHHQLRFAPSQNTNKRDEHMRAVARRRERMAAAYLQHRSRSSAVGTVDCITLMSGPECCQLHTSDYRRSGFLEHMRSLERGEEVEVG
jgi:hypothetical protein